MVARLTAFRTRAQLNMRAPRARSTNITPQHGGVAVHWGGPGQSVGSHARCEQIWRSWQNYHMDTHGWVDIAYTAAFCNHGYALAGRGYGTRTAANGTNAGNQNYYAFVWIGGSGDGMTQAAVDALEWLIRDARSKGAGRRVRPHRVFTGSTCPGNSLANHANRLDNANISDGGSGGDDDMDPKDWSDAGVARMQAIISRTVLHNAERNIDYMFRHILSQAQAANDGIQAVATVLDAHTQDGGVDSEKLAQDVAAALGEDLERIATEVGKSAAEVTVSDVVRKHGEALLAGLEVPEE